MKSSPPNNHTHGPISSKQLSPSTWKDFEHLFAAHKGVWGGCWCMFFHSPGGFDSGNYTKNKQNKKSLVNHGKAHGTLVYCGTDTVGWCQFGPREELRRIDSKRNYVATSDDAWRITCLFTDRHHRRSGIGSLAVAESLKAMRHLGVESVEAYPSEGNSATLLWSGTPELFEKHGFKRVRPLGKTSWIYSRSLH